MFNADFYFFFTPRACKIFFFLINKCLYIYIYIFIEFQDRFQGGKS